MRKTDATRIYKRAKGGLKYEAERKQADVTRAHVTLFLHAAMRASRVSAESAISAIFSLEARFERAGPNSLLYIKKSYYPALILSLSLSLVGMKRSAGALPRA